MKEFFKKAFEFIAELAFVWTFCMICDVVVIVAKNSPKPVIVSLVISLIIVIRHTYYERKEDKYDA